MHAKKIVGHGNWQQWLGDNAPDRLTERSAQRFMKLSKSPILADLESAASVCEAYTLAGLMPEREHGEPSDDKQKGNNYVVHLSRTLDVLNQAYPEAWQPQDKAQLIARLKPLVAIYERLVERTVEC